MMQQKERLEKQLDFIREIDKEKEIFRQTYLADASRKENDAEHAWHMAIMTMLLSEYANEKIDVLKTVGIALIHDIVEMTQETHMPMMRQARPHSMSVSRRRRSVYTDSCQRNRASRF